MDAFDLLMNDHRKVSEIFDRMESGDASLRRELFPRLKQELDVHAHVEETIFYPALKERAETRDLATHAYSEHNEVKQLLEELRADLAQLAQSNTRSHHRYLTALEAVLAEPQPPGTLLQLVEGYGNWSLDHDPTDSGAAAFLAGLIRMLREIIAETERRD